MIKTRFCPSPTGLIHLGNARTALFALLYAKNQEGSFLLRIEDTDVERSKPEYTQQLMEDLRWLGWQWDEGPEVESENGPYCQSERAAIYDDYYERLMQTDRVYPCFCSEEDLALMRKVQRSSGKPPRYDGTCRRLTEEEKQAKKSAGVRPTLRFHVPEKETITFTDLLRGPQEFRAQDIGDFIIRRANGTSPFMFCNAIDDALMGVTHVIRGEDHLANTPRQILIFNALGLTIPEYMHIALIVGPDGSPLSKRHGSRNIQELRESGYLPLAISNYLARLGHHFESDALCSLAKLGTDFSVASLSKSPAKFDLAQLNHWQKLVVLAQDFDAAWSWMAPHLTVEVPAEDQAQFVETVLPNVVLPAEADAWARVFYADTINWEPDCEAILEAAGPSYLQALKTAFTAHGLNSKAVVDALKTELGVKGKALFQPLRVALTGRLEGPELDKIVALLGLERIQRRLDAHVKNL